MIFFNVVQKIDEGDIIEYIRAKNITSIEQVDPDAVTEYITRKRISNEYSHIEPLNQEDKSYLLEKIAETLGYIESGHITINYKI